MPKKIRPDSVGEKPDSRKLESRWEMQGNAILYLVCTIAVRPDFEHRSRPAAASAKASAADEDDSLTDYQRWKKNLKMKSGVAGHGKQIKGIRKGRKRM